MSNTLRLLAQPDQISVKTGPDGSPVIVDVAPVAHIREAWLVEDRWWTDKPLRRAYWEVVTKAGRCEVLFRNLINGKWYRQRGA